MLRILVTRPHPHGESLCHLLIKHGMLAFHCPTIAFAPPQHLSALMQQLPCIAQQDWLIFNSPQAVLSLFPLMAKQGICLPKTVRLAAIGPGTVKSLQQFVASTTHSPLVVPDTEWHSGGILALPHFQTASIRNKRVMLVCGEKGRTQLASTLQARGAQVTLLSVYRRIVPAISITPFIHLLITNAIDIIVATSGTGVQQLKTLFQTIWPCLATIPLVVISERIKILAKDCGFQSIWVIDPTTDMAQAITIFLSEKGKIICQKP